jgi:hypothetical protein
LVEVLFPVECEHDGSEMEEMRGVVVATEEMVELPATV